MASYVERRGSLRQRNAESGIPNPAVNLSRHGIGIFSLRLPLVILELKDLRTIVIRWMLKYLIPLLPRRCASK